MSNQSNQANFMMEIPKPENKKQKRWSSKLPKKLNIIMQTETEEHLARQAKEAAEQKVAENLRKQRADKFRIQPFSSSTTDEHGRHHVVRSWKIASNEKAVK